MRYSGLADFLRAGRSVLSKGPVAIIVAEDEVEVESTLRHHLGSGFREVILLIGSEPVLPESLSQRIHQVPLDLHVDNAMVTAVNAVLAATVPGVWLYYCFNAEYLFHPFCETRRVSELLAFHAEERRDAMVTFVIDLYAIDLQRYPNAVTLDEAYLDRSGYYALARQDPDKDWQPKDRQLDFYGGLRWRFEEHVPWTRRRIDRISLFRAKKGLHLRPDFTFDDEEYNTFSCPWHNNLTAAICSFRTAKALKSNPGSRWEIRSFEWHNSARFQWHSQQLMDLGLMEPGQWF